ncbi:MAG: hypothetical protein JST11_12410 [Acidobacteria bacterium]|nr:hypothetical protein [Acidobacteriota bacterium]
MLTDIRRTCGIVLIAVGVLAIPIPVIPGIPLIAAGAAMLGRDHPLIRSGRAWLEDRGILTQARNKNELSNVQS